MSENHDYPEWTPGMVRVGNWVIEDELDDSITLGSGKAYRIRIPIDELIGVLPWLIGYATKKRLTPVNIRFPNEEDS